ncbi:MAG: Hsp20/alpha crystallin family protein [Planctomycetota bacterium]
MDLMPWRKRGQREPAENPLARVRSEIEDVFERLFRDPWGLSAGALTAVHPRLDVSETEDEVTVRAELPGIRAEDVNIEVTGNVLRLYGEKAEEREEHGRSFRYTERQYGSFSRTIELPAGVDADQVDATYKDGVLHIRMPKSPEAKPRRIEVKPARQLTR